MDLGTAPQGEIPTVVLLGDTLTLHPPLALLDMVDMFSAAAARIKEIEIITRLFLVKLFQAISMSHLTSHVASWLGGYSLCLQ